MGYDAYVFFVDVLVPMCIKKGIFATAVQVRILRRIKLLIALRLLGRNPFLVKWWVLYCNNRRVLYRKATCFASMGNTASNCWKISKNVPCECRISHKIDPTGNTLSTCTLFLGSRLIWANTRLTWSYGTSYWNI
jgi:hypothetical protein